MLRDAIQTLENMKLNHQNEKQNLHLENTRLRSIVSSLQDGFPTDFLDPAFQEGLSSFFETARRIRERFETLFRSNQSLAADNQQHTNQSQNLLQLEQEKQDLARENNRLKEAVDEAENKNKNLEDDRRTSAGYVSSLADQLYALQL